MFGNSKKKKNFKIQLSVMCEIAKNINNSYTIATTTYKHQCIWEANVQQYNAVMLFFYNDIHLLAKNFFKT